jgi:hypothetical protein
MEEGGGGERAIALVCAEVTTKRAQGCRNRSATSAAKSNTGGTFRADTRCHTAQVLRNGHDRGCKRGSSTCTCTSPLLTHLAAARLVRHGLREEKMANVDGCSRYVPATAVHARTCAHTNTHTNMHRHDAHEHVARPTRSLSRACVRVRACVRALPLLHV